MGDKDIDGAGGGQSAFLQSVLERAGALGLCHEEPGRKEPLFTLWNEAMAELTGYSQEAINRLGWFAALFPEGALRERLEARMAGGDDLRGEEWSLQRADGARRLVSLSTSVIANEGGRPGQLVLMSDVTSSHQRMRRALQRSERFLEDVVESIQDGVSVLDTELNIVHVNAVMKRWYSENLPLVGKRCHECYHNEVEPCDPCPTLRAFRSGQTEHEVVPGLAGSAVEWIELFSYPIRDRVTGEVTGVVEFVRDITEKRHLEAKLLQAQKMEAIGTLASGIAHDFNNILTGILGDASLMLAGLDPSDQLTTGLQRIEAQVESAMGLTGQLLGLAQGGKYEPKPTDPNGLVSRTADLFGRSRKEIVLHRRFQQGVWSISVDGGQLEQVLLNLLVNAWQAMPEGGEVFIDTENVTLGRQGTLPECVPGRYVKISITDSGVGMDKAVLERIFDPFFTTKERGRGTGLGLASSYGIVRNHGGTIHVYSEPGEGSTFSVYLPAVDEGVEEDQPEREQTLRGEGTVLLADDEAIVIDVAQRMLEWLGYEVLVARTGEEALSIFEQERARIDLVIMDLVMPGLCGRQLFERLKGLAPELKVLLSSGYSANGQASQLLEQGCDGFLQKPFRLETLGRKVAEVLGRR